MKIKTLQLKNFKRVNDLSIQGLPETARLVVLIGPNGCGKSSIFDAFSLWHSFNGYSRDIWDPYYYPKEGIIETVDLERIKVDFYSSLDAKDEPKKLFYIRSSYRGGQDASYGNISQTQPYHFPSRMNQGDQQKDHENFHKFCNLAL